MLLGLTIACSSVPNAFQRPNAVAVGPEGAVFVSDFLNHRIVELDADGAVVRTIGRAGVGGGHVWQPSVLAFANGELLVSDHEPREEDAQWVAKRFRDGSAAGWYPLTTAPDTSVEWIDGIDVLPDGTVLTAEQEPRLVRRWEADFSSWEVFASGYQASSVAVSGQQVFVVDQYGHRVYRYSLDGNPLGAFGEPGEGEGQLAFPSAIAACPDRFLAVADMANYRVAIFGWEGEYRNAFSPRWVAPDHPVQLMDLEVSPDCTKLYLVDSKGNRVLVTDLDGAVLNETSTW